MTQRREAPDGISDISLRLTKVALGGQERFTGELRDGMRQTLARMKADAEAVNRARPKSPGSASVGRDHGRRRVSAG